MLVDFDDLRLLISQWQTREEAPHLAASVGFAMTRVHLESGLDVVVSQFSVRSSFLNAIDAIVGDTSARLVEVTLTAEPECVAGRFRKRREERTAAGAADVGGDIPTGDVDEVVRWADEELRRLVAARPDAIAVDATDDVESTLSRVLEVLGVAG